MANFKSSFSRSLEKGPLKQHFRSTALRDLFHNQVSGPENVSQPFIQKMLEYAHLTPEASLAHLNSRLNGLTLDEVEKIRAKLGPNEVEHEKPMSGWVHLWLCYRSPFSLLLTAQAIVSYLTGDPPGTITIVLMVILSTILRFVQERKSNLAAEKLKAFVSNHATVLRSEDVSLSSASKNIEIPTKDLVPGDILILSAGDMIPADLRILTANDLFIGQSALTGESMPVEKSSTLNHPNLQNPLEAENLCFMGTNVVSGSATAVVIGTGNNTYFGAIAVQVTAVDRKPTQFQVGVNKVSWLLIRFMMVMAPLVLLINGFTKGNWLEASLFALSVAVGLTPEMLPMIVTSTLAKGALMMSKKKVIVKRLDAIQNFGAMNILCTDKTGTLTQDKIGMKFHIDVIGEASESVLALAYLNSYYQTGLKNLLDVAVLAEADQDPHLIDVAKSYQKIDEIPFDFSRRRLSVVLADHSSPSRQLICKGALEEILSICSQTRMNNEIKPLTSELLTKISTITRKMNEEGLRVVAVASKNLSKENRAYTVADETDLILEGYIAFLDPPKETTAPALKLLKQNGIDIKILTGDNELVSLKVCYDVGLEVNGVLLGDTIETLNNDDLTKQVETATIFAKLTPLHKERVVQTLRANGHVVGFMGDGINDAPAIRAADVGISVDSAVDIAKEAADIILLEKSLLVLNDGVIEGRKIFANMLKYIKMTASSNFGNVFSVLIASAFIPFLPMLPLHLLVQNLLYDFSQTAIPFDNVDQELLSKPQKWNPDNLGRFMVFFGPTSSVFDVITFLILWFIFGANSPEKQTLFQSGWFIEGLVSQTLIVHMIRTRKIPFIQSRASASLIFTTLGVVALGIYIPMGPFAEYFRLQAMPLNYFIWLIPILIGYMLLTQLMKRIFNHYYEWN